MMMMMMIIIMFEVLAVVGIEITVFLCREG